MPGPTRFRRPPVLQLDAKNTPLLKDTMMNHCVFSRHIRACRTKLNHCPPHAAQNSRLFSRMYKKGFMCRVASEIRGIEDEMTEEDRAAEILMGTTRRIQMLGQQGRAKEAISALAGLAEQGVQPDTVAATTLVRACTKDMALAQSVFDELFDGEFLIPDEVTFAVLLRGYGNRSPPDWPRIDATLSTMRNKFGISPTATSFNPLLEVCSRTNDLDRGQDVIDRMASDEVMPDEYSMEAVCKRKVLRSYLKKTFDL
ncbi:hypothetical protein CEUSTIGMA_g3630.t1 [Chlamydomonas eustigma]|uniref:Pentacotripeptide-repeat region of PRORP domain-containing protein n=1 Tax=Chlamydomonas eustigma TaxID=1157962 RepID=A0A250WZI1_9CHLO|nr:hypothetical protein CEUSTIGMA_g3630.t1 [Chlamydomonas eustigma]|eukprot:GAX76186.1 hypothetical protein CEUSTIGMA_g3630.t1 [Chlamydomonas eustigma]